MADAVDAANATELKFLDEPLPNKDWLTVRSYNCLIEPRRRREAKEPIDTRRKLIKQTERDLFSLDNFGRKSLNEIKEVLHSEGLHLDMTDDEIAAFEEERGEVGQMELSAVTTDPEDLPQPEPKFGEATYVVTDTNFLLVLAPEGEKDLYGRRAVAHPNNFLLGKNARVFKIRGKDQAGFATTELTVQGSRVALLRWLADSLEGLDALLELQVLNEAAEVIASAVLAFSPASSKGSITVRYPVKE